MWERLLSFLILRLHFFRLRKGFRDKVCKIKISIKIHVCMPAWVCLHVGACTAFAMLSNSNFSLDSWAESGHAGAQLPAPGLAEPRSRNAKDAIPPLCCPHAIPPIHIMFTGLGSNPSAWRNLPSAVHSDLHSTFSKRLWHVCAVPFSQ